MAEADSLIWLATFYCSLGLASQSEIYVLITLLITQISVHFGDYLAMDM